MEAEKKGKLEGRKWKGWASVEVDEGVWRRTKERAMMVFRPAIEAAGWRSWVARCLVVG